MWRRPDDTDIEGDEARLRIHPPLPLWKLAPAIKPGPGAKKFGDCCLKTFSLPVLPNHVEFVPLKVISTLGVQRNIDERANMNKGLYEK